MIVSVSPGRLWQAFFFPTVSSPILYPQAASVDSGKAVVLVDRPRAWGLDKRYAEHFPISLGCRHRLVGTCRTLCNGETTSVFLVVTKLVYRAL